MFRRSVLISLCLVIVSVLFAKNVQQEGKGRLKPLLQPKVEVEGILKQAPLSLFEKVEGLPTGKPGIHPYLGMELKFEPELFDSSNNGYGWYQGATTPVAYTPAGWLLAVYRKFNESTSGEIGAAAWETMGELHNRCVHGNINTTPCVGSGRYPAACATPNYPYAFWTEYFSKQKTVAGAYMSLDEEGWCEGFWTIPEDMAQNGDPGVIHSLWLGMVDMVLAGDTLWHIGGLWERELNEGYYTFIHGTSPDGINWTWNVPELDITPSDIPEMNVPQFVYGKDGFGIWMCTGHTPEFSDFWVIYSTTNDYGETWSEVKHIKPSDIGIPNEISGVNVGGFTWAQSANINDETNAIYFGATIIHGEDVGGGYYYPLPQHEGIYCIYSIDLGATWKASRIAFNNGWFVGDEAGQIENLNEVDISFDDHGRLYAAWIDRPHTDLIESQYNATIGEPYYYQDIYASVSLDSGRTWGYPTTIVKTVEIPEQTPHMARQASSVGNPGTIYIGYTVPDPARITVTPPSMWSDHVQWNYMVEVDSLDTEGHWEPDPHYTFTQTDSFYTIVIDSASIDTFELDIDDAIGVFTTDGVCVGASNYWWGFTDFLVWKDDPNTPEKDGYTVGDTMHFKIWEDSLGVEYEPTAYYTVGDGTFGYGTYSRLTLIFGAAPSKPTGLAWNFASDSELVWNPNPEPNISGYKLFYGNSTRKGYSDSVNVGNVTKYDLETLGAPGLREYKYITCTAYSDEGQESEFADEEWVVTLADTGEYSFDIITTGTKNGGRKIGLSIPDGALSTNAKIGIDQELNPTPSMLDSLPEEWLEFAVNIASDIALADSIDLTFCYRDQDAAGYNESSISIYKYDDPTWKEIESTVDTAQNKVTGKIESFSLFTICANDNEGPTFSESMIWTDTDSKGPFPCSTIVQDPSGVDSAFLHYFRVTHDSGWICITMPHYGDIYENDIPKIDSASVIRYYYEAFDGANPTNQATDPANADTISNFYSFNASGVEEISTSPNVFALSQGYPNPMNRTIAIQYSIPKTAKVTLKVYDLTGRLVTTLVNGIRKPSSYTATWDARNSNGEKVANGIYFYRLSAGSFVATRKIILLK
ncbi:T9SS type A sorting domain-containing protein [candidate division WOR-3 bacterium]|nr:T9SS type A sorting domain-containing protein [candidate division WOR-3 bacterium]